MLSMKNPNVFLDKDHSEETTLTLLDLPVEVFLHICSFLDASTLVHGLGSACKQFYEILRDDSLWKVRIAQIWQNSRYPVLPPDENDELFWKQSCVGIEKHLSYWNDKNSIRELKLAQQGHYSAIDTLMLLDKGRFLISGGRDRCLCCWDLGSGRDAIIKHNANQMCHDGWIWDLTAVDSTIYSCSWDKTIKSWNLNDLRLEPVRKFTIDVAGALLCVTSYPGIDVLATGSHCRSVILLDPRERAPIVRYRTHRRAVLRVAMNDNYVLSASEDKTVVVWDQRAGKVMKTIEISKNSFPMSMIMEKRAVHVGDSGGNIHLLDPKRDFELVKSWATGHAKGIKSLCSTTGGLITGSLDTTVRLLSPTDPPRLIASLSSSVGEIAGMDYMNGVLAISGSHIQIWRPKTGSAIENS